MHLLLLLQGVPETHTRTRTYTHIDQRWLRLEEEGEEKATIRFRKSDQRGRRGEEEEEYMPV